MKKYLLFAVVFAVLIGSCKQEESGSKPQVLLDKVVTKEGADSAVASFTCNSQNKLTLESADDKINLLYSNESALVEYVDNQYVSPNNVTRISYVATTPSNSFSVNFSYEYRADGRPTKSTASAGDLQREYLYLQVINAGIEQVFLHLGIPNSFQLIQGFELTNKIAIVTGASKGIGKAIAMLLGQQGATVVVSSRKQDAVDETATSFKHLGINARGIAAHMGDLEQVRGLLEQTVATFGGVDIIVNNAAINPSFGPIIDTDMKVFDKIMEVNVKGPLELCKLAYPMMKQRGGGSIINISSIEGLTPGFGLGLYSISKSTLIAMTKVLAREWGVDHIRANVICPGLVKTKFSEALTSNDKIMKMVMARQALPMVAEPEDIAGLALYLASDAARFSTGAVFTLDGGMTI